MAEILENHPGWNHSRSRDHLTMAERYPLDQWLDGRVWYLEQGTDFTEDVDTFRSGLRHWAKELYKSSLRSAKADRMRDGVRYFGINVQAVPR